MNDQYNDLQDRLTELTLQHGYALECIRELLTLAESAGHEKAVAVKVAQRFIAELAKTEGGK